MRGFFQVVSQFRASEHFERIEIHMARTNYSFEKRQKELAKKKKTEEKKQRKLLEKQQSPAGENATDSNENNSPQEG